MAIAFVATVIPRLDEARGQRAYLEDCRQRLVLAEKAVARIVGNCPHEEIESVMRRADYYRSRPDEPRGQDVCVAKVCRDCGLVVWRPKGWPWDICWKCWGPMIRLADEKQGGVYMHINRCWVCGHIFETNMM